MQKRSRFKKNHYYKKTKDNSFARLIEVGLVFVASFKNCLYSKKSKRYFQGANVTDWQTNSTSITSSVEPFITWIGHSTFLIQIGGVNILTDPIFSDLMYLYPRNCAPGIALHDLPKIDFIIISHNHQDHMEKKSLLALKKDKPHILVPKGDKKWFDKNNFENVSEYDWWQDQSFGSAKFTFLPAIHWSGNGFLHLNKSLWGSWMIEYAGFKLYFAGDTAYSSHFSEIADKFNGIDLVLMPIGPNGPRELQKHSHINTYEAVKAFIDLKAKSFVPMHWGTFRLGQDKFDAPIKLLKKYWQELEVSLKDKKLHIPKFGEQLKFGLPAKQ